MEKEFKLVFDNAGGLIIYLGKEEYIHFYENMGQAAEDVKTYLSGANTVNWEGNLGKQFFEEEREENRDTKLTLYNLSDLEEKIEWGNNVKCFYEAMKECLKKCDQ